MLRGSQISLCSDSYVSGQVKRFARFFVDYKLRFIFESENKLSSV